MQRLLSLALVLPTMAAAAAATTTTVRRLEDYGMNGYFKFSKCLRVKIVEDNDDDGNAYFYNGAYRSQSLAYASFVKCDQGCDSSCDITSAYVAELDGILENALGYSQGYCQSCAAQCRRRRRLDEEKEQEEEENGGNQNYSVDCKTCAEQCYYQFNAAGGLDESEYLDCQYQYTDDAGIDYYGAPTCSTDGMMMMGLFYDDECTIKKSEEESDFSKQFAYNAFHTMESVCMSCQDGICEDISNDATQCVDGRTADGGDDDMGVCKAYKRMAKEWQYAKAKKKSKLPIIILCLIVVGGLCFLSYSYYVRHKNANSASTKTALLETENVSTPASGGDYTSSHA